MAVCGVNVEGPSEQDLLNTNIIPSQQDHLNTNIIPSQQDHLNTNIIPSQQDHLNTNIISRVDHQEILFLTHLVLI